MIKKIVSVSIVMAAVFMLIGCGGGSGSTTTATTTTTSPTTPTTQVTTTDDPIVATPTMRTGTGYYVDSAVSGVTFQCGTASGVTDENGTFTFSFNADDAGDEVCTFTLNGLVLRTLNEGDIGDEETIFEDAVFIAQLLQTLDNDGNASNGITITPEAIALLSDPLPETDQDLDDLVILLVDANISYEGHAVTEEEALAHLEETRQVLDTTAPVVTMIGDNPMVVMQDAVFADPGISATDDYYEVSEINITAVSDVDTSVPGVYTITYSAEDGAGNTAAATRTVTVRDETNPIILLTGDDPQILEIGEDTYVELNATANDNTDGDISSNIIIDASGVDVSTLGSYVVTYSVSDAGGNSVTVTRVVNVTDTIVPVLTVQGASPLTVEINTVFVDPGVDVLDNSAEAIVLQVSSLDMSVLGEQTITYTATDSSGNTATATRTVNVTDTTEPTVTLKGSSTVNLLLNDSYSDPGATVIDNSEETINAVASGVLDTATVGTYTLTYTATDSSNNVGTVTRTVNISAGNPPVITLLGNSPYEVEVGSIYTDPGANVTDTEDSTVTVTNDSASAVNVSAPGTYTVTYTATDSHDNTVQTTRTVNVVDTTDPEITITGDNPMSINQDATYIEQGAIVSDNSGETIDAVASGSVDTATVGTYTITYTAKDSSNNEVTVTRTVHVLDLTAPDIQVEGPSPWVMEIGTDFSEPGVVAIDAVDGQVDVSTDTSALNTAVLGMYTVTYTARDNVGNEATAIRDVNVTDTIAPVVALIGENSINVLLNDDYLEQDATVLDNSGETLSAVITGTVDTTTVGNYTLTYTATDSSGNEGATTRTVNVTTGNAPTISFEPFVDLTFEIGSTYIDVPPTVTDIEDDNDGIEVNVTHDANTSVDTSTLGTYMVTYTAIDSNDNTVQASRTVYVVDTTVPVITVTGDTLMNINQNANYTEPGATATDNSGESITVNINGTVDTATVGVYTITYTAADSTGNEAVAVTRTVNVLDATAPVITVEGDNPYAAEVGTTYFDPGVTSTDEVDGNVNVDINTTALNMSVLGFYTVTYTATDNAGNSATASRDINVTDTTPPEITISGENPLNLLVGDTYAEQGTIVIDNYDTGLSTSVVSNDVNTSEVGLYQVVYHVVDTSGNEANATRVVNVTAGQPPVITLSGPNPYDVQLGTGYSDPGAGANDPEDGPVPVDINASEVDTNLLGTYTVYFEATDGQGNTAYATRTVNVVENVNLTANPDSPEPQPTSVDDMVTLHVAANDYIPSGADIVDVFLKVWDPQQSIYNYLKSLQVEGQGWWTVIGQSIEFTPDGTFSGGQVYMEYQITDSNGDIADSWIFIEYPEVLVARYDDNSSALIEPYSMNVLENDVYMDAAQVTIGFFAYDQNGQEIITPEINNNEGNWTVSNQQVLFTPSSTFSGGTVWMDYRIEENGRFSRAQISITYPIYVQAGYDQIDMTDLLSVTYAVMENDTLGTGVTGDVYVLDYSTQPAQQVKQMVDHMGEWIVEANQSITFNPAPNFTGGNAHVEYVLTDNNGHYSQTGFDVHYPMYLQANHDRVEGLTDIETVNVDVLSNDDLPEDNSTVIVKIQSGWDQQGQTTYGTRYEDLRGVWQLEADRTVTFTPKDTFGGGTVWLQYQISDTEGHVSQSAIEIAYPLFVEAWYDDTHAMDVTQAITYNVLGNDRVGEDVEAIVQLVEYINGQPSGYTNSYTDHLGTWTVTDNNITFTPDSNFGGGDAHVEYVLTDGNDHYSQAGFTIHYPISATPVCTVDVLDTVDAVSDALAGGLSFFLVNGERRFEAELDDEAYVIDPALYGSSAVSGLNPMYMVHYREQTRITQGGDTFVEVEMSSTTLSFKSINSTWNYLDQMSGNDRGYKYTASEGEGGSYVVEGDDSNTLSIGGDAVFSFKVVLQITTSEINNILESAGIHLTLDAGDTAQMQLSKELMSEYDWWGAVDQNTYADFNAFLTAKSFDSSADHFDWNKVLINNQTGQKAILFAEGASDRSGTLIEIDTQNNVVLADIAGSWEIKEIDDNGNIYDILVASPSLCGYEERIYKIENSSAIQGHMDEAGVIGAEYAFSESLKDKLADYFIDEAPLNIDPNDPNNNPEITENMLSGQIFYTVREDQSTGVTYYSRLTVNSPDQLTKEDFAVAANGDLLPSTTGTMNYELDSGRIRIQGEGDIKIGLNSEPAVDADWDVTIYTWDSMSQEIWLLTKPADFPQ